jgi:exopolysaccharide biosynthesis predicted pyruvyltransferase EpsI
VAGLLLDRKVILLPNSYHKNTSMYETWLADLGCDYTSSLEEALQRINRATKSWLFQTRHFLSSAAQKVRCDWRRAA